jgi:integrase
VHRIRRVLAVKLEGVELRDWLFRDLRRRHVNELVDHMLSVQRRAPSGAIDILRALSAMCEDAITDELCDANPFKGVRVRASDPRALKQSRPPRVWSWDQMHAFAAAAGRWEPMIRTLADSGLRIGELLALERAGVDFDAATLTVAGTAWNGRVVASSREKRHDRIVPVPPGCLALIMGMAVQLHSRWLFPTPTGLLWRYDNFRRDVWVPTVEAAGIAPTPQEFRHSWNTHLRAAGVDPADLAEMAGHTVSTATARYTHPLRRSFDDVRRLVG